MNPGSIEGQVPLAFYGFCALKKSFLIAIAIAARILYNAIIEWF
jgi:hypothetical protein